MEEGIVRFVTGPGEKCGLKVHFLCLSVILIDTRGVRGISFSRISIGDGTGGARINTETDSSVTMPVTESLERRTAEGAW